MKFRVKSKGENLGTFSFAELEQRHAAGTFSGAEYVQREGASDWQPLELVLAQGYADAPVTPPMSATANPALLAGIIGGAFFLFFIFIGALIFFTNQARLHSISNQPPKQKIFKNRPEALRAANRPIVWTKNSLTEKDAQSRKRDFRIRQWLDGFAKNGAHNPAVDAEEEKFLRVWIARYYGGPEESDPMSLGNESESLANNPDCTDPLVLTVVANENENSTEAMRCYQRALDAFPASAHQAYPQLYANVWYAGYFSKQPDRMAKLDAAALQQLRKCFADGSFTPDDQQEIAEIFVNGWGETFFYRHGREICRTVHEAGTNYQWLALTLDGENEIAEAWAARGDGYANTVSSEGWRSFHSHLANARVDLTQAWQLHTNFPIAPCRMIQVALGDSDITEMRQWFDRTTVAQIDYPGAWSEMRWGLRPRWYGDESSMLAFGRAAVATGRFDTDVPRKFLDTIYDVESEEGTPAHEHIFGRGDIWPELQKLYEGYLADESQAKWRSGWRTSYAIIAYKAKKFDVARQQLEALNWQPLRSLAREWTLDSNWTLEVAARSGSLGVKISRAEMDYQNGNISNAVREYEDLSHSDIADARTRAFIQNRLTMLKQLPK